jgi:phenylalanyl-tRNA synthetase alpha chain
MFGYSAELDKWIEVGNSGVFRPEMLAPMGLPPGVKVIAWGLSLERPTMIKYGIHRIQELFGHRMRIDRIAKNPVARYD